MNVLVITDVLWREDNGVGNSYSNLFRNMNDVKFANICCQQGHSDNSISTACFQISEGSLLRNLKNKNLPSGIVEEKSEEKEQLPVKGFAKFLRRSRLQIFFWIRNFIWKIGRWKSAELKKFIDDFKPDVIFAQLQDKIYLNNLIRFIKDYTGKPLFLYAWDDVYSLKQFSYSPLFYVDRLFQRRSIRKLVKKCNLLYTISELQREEYAKSLKVKTELLYKGYDFENASPIVDRVVSDPIKILYAGNLYSGRYKTIKKISKIIGDFNRGDVKCELSIYSASPLSNKQIDKINKNKGCRFYGKVSEKRVVELQKESDVVLHVEPFTLKGSLLCRLSFSTKLVDYFYNSKCIFAVGHKRCSSMQYLAKNDCAEVHTNLKHVNEFLQKICDEKSIVSEYGEKAFETGKKNHKIQQIQDKLIKNFTESLD